MVELRRRYVDQGRPLPMVVETALRSDARPGARALLAAIENRRRERRAEGQRLRFMLRYEVGLWASGIARIAGVDEAGMSPLAGPVAAAAVILPEGTRLPEVDDSKKLDAASRARLAPVIRERALAYAVAFADVDEIDRLNIYWAGILAMRRAIAALSPTPEHVLVDGRPLRGLSVPHDAIVRGDARSLSIAAASILAKTARDALMDGLDGKYPGYGFSQHKGYPVRAHVAALERLGPSPIHRRSFAPVRAALGLAPIEEWPPPQEAAAGLERLLKATP